MTENTPLQVGYLVAEKDGETAVTVIINGSQQIISKAHPNFDTIMVRLFEEDYSDLFDLINVGKAIERRFKKISERVSVSKGRVYFDNDPIENELSEHLMRLIREGKSEDDIKYLVNFWEKVASNPSKHSRDHLMRWLNTHDFSITKDGDIVAYKGLRADGTSVHSGPGIVNGVQMRGHLPNEVGSIIEISRESVVANSAIGCAFGLHVGTFEYASKFGQGRLVEVTVNPRDVVSVPTDCADAKVRVCRYKVAKIQEGTRGKRTESVVDYDNDFKVEDDKSKWVEMDYTTGGIIITTDWNSI